MTNNHFQILGDEIGPQPWMQQRIVKTSIEASVSRDYDTGGGQNKNDLIHLVAAKWTNNTPIAQWVYGLVTRDGHSVALQARSRGYISTSHAFDITATSTDPTSFDYVEVSKSGIGMDKGVGGLLGVGTGFGIVEKRDVANTVPLMPHRPGWFRIEPGKTFHARVLVRFVSEFWENSLIDGGDSSTHSGFISGETRLDLVAVPIFDDPGPRATPSIVGASGAHAFSATTTVAKVVGVAAGDTILAFVMNQFGLDSDITPVQSGWTLMHRPARTEGLYGWEDVHMRVYQRVATGSEPASYSFNNGLLADEIVIMVVLRNVSTDLTDGWYFASAVRRYWWERDDGHIAPTIDRNGQLLFSLSYIAHAGGQTPMTQTHPDGMTELIEIPSALCTASLAYLITPPRPTQERVFVPSATPFWSGHNICLSALIPGKTP